jgi:hypothetical protein
LVLYSVGTTDLRDLWIYAIEMVSCGMTYIPSFMKIGKSVRALLRRSFRTLKGCNVGITDGGVL